MEAKLWALPRGTKRDGPCGENPATWVAKYCSLIVSIWDVATAEGFNEADLACNLLYLAKTDYGTRDVSKPGVTIATWVQYFLDQYGSVAEVVKHADDIQVVTFKIVHKDVEVDGPAHLCFSDSTGDSCIIEVFDGKTTVHHGSQCNVMTNSPPFDQQLENLKQYHGFGGDKPIPGTPEANDRFVRCAYYGDLLPKDPDTYEEAAANVLSVMHSASTPFGVNDPERPNISATLYRSVIDCTKHRYYFEFCDQPNVVWFDEEEFDSNEGAPIKSLDLRGNFKAAGDVTKLFTDAEPFQFIAGESVLGSLQLQLTVSYASE